MWQFRLTETAVGSERMAHTQKKGMKINDSSFRPENDLILMAKCLRGVIIDIQIESKIYFNTQI